MNPVQLGYLRNIPLRFETVSRLRLKVQPELIPAGRCLRHLLGSRVVPSSNLSSPPSSASVKAKVVWGGVVERF